MDPPSDLVLKSVVNIHFSRKIALSEEEASAPKRTAVNGLLDKSRFLDYEKACVYAISNPELRWRQCACVLPVLRSIMSNAEISVLSAGAVQPGMAKVIDAFQRATAQNVSITFATLPMIHKRIGDPNPPDVVIAPLAVLEEWAKTGKAVSRDRVMVGRIGVGMMLRDGARPPDIGSVAEFKRSLLNSQSIVYNQASTGIYLESLFERLGIKKQLEKKTTRYPDAAAVLNHVSKGKGNEIGFGATTVIIEHESKGLKFVGPLPPEIQNYTSYTAMVMNVASEGAREFIRYLTRSAAKKILTAAGIE